ncbi:MAG TPA: TolC family protein [Burkholderiales bacterium]|nr:TolC family protein [Burkholderiales bacterium]
MISPLVLSACATYQDHPIKLDDMGRAFESRSLESAELQNFIGENLHRDVGPWPLQQWDLSTLTLAAYYYNPELDVARAKWSVAEAAVTTAGQRPNPTLQLPFGYTVDPKNGDTPWTYGINLDIPVETAGKRGYRIAKARQLSMSARLDIGNVAWQVRNRLRSELLNLYAAARRVTFLEEVVNAQQDIADMLDKRLLHGAASAAEVREAKIVLGKSRRDLLLAEMQTRDARARVASAIGIPISALNDTKISFDVFEQSDFEIPDDEVRYKAVLARPDLLSALAKYEASQAALQLEIAKQYPDIHLGPGYLYNRDGDSLVLPISFVALPLFSRNEGPIAEAEAKRDEAAAQVKALQARAINEAEQALKNYYAAEDNLASYDALLSAQESQMKALQNAFVAGETDRLTVTQAQRALFSYRVAGEDPLIQVQQAIGQLENALQRPLSAPSDE